MAIQGAMALVIAARPGEPPRNTFARALSAGTSCGRPWVVYLQDDAVLCPDFCVRLADYLRPEATFSVLALYSDRRRVLDAYHAEQSLVRLTTAELTMAVGLAVASAIVTPFTDWLLSWEASHPEHKAAFDLALGAFCRSEKLLIAAAVPSLVQHRDSSSLLGHPCGRRQSRTFRLAHGEVPPC